MIASMAVCARRRAVTLSPAAGRPGAAMTRASAHLDGLALPPAVVRACPYLPAAGLLAAGAAFALIGLPGVIGLVAIAAAADLTLRRTAPGRRVAATERALPTVLDAVARHLRAGGSLAQALAAARPPATAPDLQRSWDRLVDLIPLVGITAALDDWAAPRPQSSGAIRLAAAAVSLAAATGGSPARAIDGVAATLRSRLAVADEVRALSSQARASAVVIALAPIVFGLLAGASDGRARAFLASPTGLALLLAGLTLDAVGAWWMAHLCGPPTT